MGHQAVAAFETAVTVEGMWEAELDRLQHAAASELRAMQEHHEDAIAHLRLDQVRS